LKELYSTALRFVFVPILQKFPFEKEGYPLFLKVFLNTEIDYVTLAAALALTLALALALSYSSV